jgi:hypothetical protein
VERLATAPQIRKKARKRTCPMASSTLSPKTHRNSMLPRRCSREPCRNTLVRSVSTGGT